MTSISVPSTDWMLWRELSSSCKELRNWSCFSLLDGSSISLLAVDMILGMARDMGESQEQCGYILGSTSFKSCDGRR